MDLSLPEMTGEALLHCGDARAVLATLPEQSVQTVVTSPPYWGLRDYGVEGQIGLERTPEEYIAVMVDVFRAVWRVLRDDGTLWMNIGDGYTSGNRGYRAPDKKNPARAMDVCPDTPEGLKPKDLIGIPWMLAFALRADGWYLRQDIIWSKPNPMPESVTDRCTKAHEYIFLFSKSPRYYFDADAIKEPAQSDRPDMAAKGIRTGTAYLQQGPLASNHSRSGNKERKPASARGVPFAPGGGTNGAVAGSVLWEGNTRNKRDVWTVASKPFKGAHFATFPPALIEPCVLAGAPAGGVVLDPFHGAGTTGMVALKHGRRYVGIEINPDYLTLSRDRINKEFLR